MRKLICQNHTDTLQKAKPGRSKSTVQPSNSKNTTEPTKNTHKLS